MHTQPVLKSTVALVGWEFEKHWIQVSLAHSPPSPPPKFMIKLSLGWCLSEVVREFRETAAQTPVLEINGF